MRRLGLDVGILPPGASLDGYALAVTPCLPIVTDAALTAFTGPLLVGPRGGGKTGQFAIPPTLPPGPLRTLIPLKVVHVESLRPGMGASVWREEVDTALPFADGTYRCGKVRYLPCWPDTTLLKDIVTDMAREANCATLPLPADIRTTRRGATRFIFNHGPEDAALPGGERLSSAGVAIRRNCA